MALLHAAVAVPARAEAPGAVAVEPWARTFTLQERGCGDPAAEESCSELAKALGRRPGQRVRSFDEATATLPSRLRSDCDVKAHHIGWPTIWIRCFDEADTDQNVWLTQGIAGTDEWRTPETPGEGAHVLVATWCWRGEGFARFNFCRPGQATERTRISLIDVARGGYRNVELVEPGQGRGLLLHAGGAAMAGRWLYVADTDWVYVFNLNHFIDDGDGDYRLPVWARYAIADAGDRDRYNPFSSISIDGSGERPRLVGAEYRLDRRADAVVTIWPLRADGRLPAEARIRSIGVYRIRGDSSIDRVQGVAPAGERFLFSESSNQLERARAGVPRQTADRCVRWGAGVGEDLYASPARDLLVGINEGLLRTRSAFWAVSYRQAFGLVPPPEGWPLQRC